VDAFERARQRPHWLVPLATDSSVLTDGLLYAQWGSDLIERDCQGIKLYRLGSGMQWFTWTSAGRWFEYESDQGYALSAAVGEIFWLEDAKTIERDVSKHLAQHAPLLLDETSWLKAFSRTITLRAIDYLSLYPRGYIAQTGSRLTGEIKRSSDHLVREKLLSLGAKIVDHTMIYPKYESWANVQPGQCLELNRDSMRLRYVPHSYLTEKEKDFWQVQVQVSDAAFREVEARILERVQEACLHKDADLAAPPPSHPSAGIFHKEAVLVDWMRDGQLRFHKALPYSAASDSFLPLSSAVRDMFQEAIECYKRQSTTQAVTLTSGADEVKISPLGPLNATSGWIKTNQGWWEATGKTQRLYQEAYLFSKQVTQLDCNIMFGFPVDHQCHMWGQEASGKLFEAVKNRLYELKLTSALPIITSILKKNLPNHSRVVSTQKVVKSIKSPVKAPFSERGQLVVSGISENSDIQEWLKELQLATDVQVHPQRWGRVHPRLSDYTSSPPPQMPDGCMVLHGMTGIASWGQALHRFGQILQSGSLLSVAERRRRGFGAITMSPLGDMASGVDWGVPCTIGACPSYGKWIVFGLKPEVLMRRDLWFSDHDFGGGRCRYDLYKAYAQSLGQRRIFEPCPHTARQQHLASCKNWKHNEVWLAHSIAWEEIDSIFVTEAGNLAGKVQAGVNRALESGMIESNVQVIPYSDDGSGEHRKEEMDHPARLQEAVAGRARRIGQELNQLSMFPVS
jgi:hypothetical protein